MTPRESFTEIFLKEKGVSTDEANMKMHLHSLWKSHRSKESGGLRLSDVGLSFLVEQLKLQSYEIPFQEPVALSPQIILFFDNHMDAPYHLTTHSITVFTNKKAFELNLFATDIKKYGLMKAMSKQKSK